LWLFAFLVLLVAEEFVAQGWHVAAPEPWSAKYSRLNVVFRALAMIFLAPLSEELMFRGLLYRLMTETVVGSIGAVLIPAAAFTVIHFQYYGPEMLFIALDALFYGFARHATGSTLLTVIFHSLGNLYAAYQRVKP
jgi:membrane protease YdiL (CAAX protease family)